MDLFLDASSLLLDLDLLDSSLSVLLFSDISVFLAGASLSFSLALFLGILKLMSALRYSTSFGTVLSAVFFNLILELSFDWRSSSWAEFLLSLEEPAPALTFFTDFVLASFCSFTGRTVPFTSLSSLMSLFVCSCLLDSFLDSSLLDLSKLSLFADCSSKLLTGFDFCEAWITFLELKPFSNRLISWSFLVGLVGLVVGLSSTHSL